MSSNELAKIFGVLVPLGAVALLATVVLGANGKPVAPGEVVASGERKAGEAQSLYEWRVVGSSVGAQFPLTGQAKLAGFGDWDLNSIVAMGPDKAATLNSVLGFLAGLA